MNDAIPLFEKLVTWQIFIELPYLDVLLYLQPSKYAQTMTCSDMGYTGPEDYHIITINSTAL